MKIVYLMDDCPPESFGGAGIIAFEQIKGMALRGHEVIVITTTRDKHMVGRESYQGILIERIYNDYHIRWQAYISLYNFLVIRSVKQILEREQPDIIHLHNIHRFISYGVIGVAKQFAPVCMTVRDAMMVEYGKLFPRNPGEEIPDYRISVWKQIREQRLRWNPFRNLCIRYLASKLDALYTPSQALKIGLDQNGIRVTKVMPEGVRNDEVVVGDNEVTSFKNKYKLVHKKVLFFGGRVSTAKGALAALDILKEVKDALPNVVLLIAGKKDEYTEYLLKEAQNKDLEGRIVITGWLGREEMKSAYMASDAVLVLSQYLDPFPTINLEAMLMGKPVIGTNLGGTPEAVIDHETGLIIDPYHVEHYLSEVQKLLQNDALLSTFGKAGKERVRSEYSLEKRSAQMEEEYKTLGENRKDR